MTDNTDNTATPEVATLLATIEAMQEQLAALTAAPPAQLTVHQAMSAAMVTIGAVSKSGFNQHFKFSFRGIDGVVNAVSPGLRRHGLVIVPTLKTITYGQAPVSGGKLTQDIKIVVDYTIYGPTGDSITITVPAEAQDAGDKGTAKAMSVAFRIALLQAFSLPTEDTDPDEDVYQRTAPQNYTDKGQRNQGHQNDRDDRGGNRYDNDRYDDRPRNDRRPPQTTTARPAPEPAASAPTATPAPAAPETPAEPPLTAVQVEALIADVFCLGANPDSTPQPLTDAQIVNLVKTRLKTPAAHAMPIRLTGELARILDYTARDLGRDVPTNLHDVMLAAHAYTVKHGHQPALGYYDPTINPEPASA